MLRFRSRIRAAICVGLLYLSGGSIATGGTLLPNGMQYFTDSNGLPVSAGCVFFYVPGTTSPKATYQNSAQTIANTNPVQLDAAGRAIIYGTGTYRQIVRASNGTITPCSPAGTQIWDQITASTDSSATIFAGPSGGTPNAVTVTAPGFSGADGQVINFISTNTNTAAATLNPSGFGAVAIVRDSATGPGALTGGELVATNAVSLIYDATAGTFHILSPVTWPNAAGVPVGTVIPVAGFTAPTNYAFAYGQAVSRTTFASLLATVTSGQTGTIASGSPTITGLTDTTQFGFGMPVESVGINAGTTILSCTSTTCTMSANATVSRSGTMTFFAYGAGDGSTTFNLPDYRGVGLVGRDNMGGTAANIAQASTTITTTGASTSATVVSATGLAIGMYVNSTNVVPGTKISAISGTALTLDTAASGSGIGIAARFSPMADAQALGIRGGSNTKAQQLSEIATHNHGVTDPGHSHNILLGANVGIVLTPPASNGGTSGSGATTSSGTGISINNAGSGNPMMVFNPNRTVNYAVRLVP